MTPNRIALLLLAFALALAPPVLAQVPLGQTPPDASSDATTELPPGPATLEPGWWRYVSAAEPADKPDRIGALVSEAEAAVLALRVEDAADAGAQIERLRAQLDALVRLQTQPSQDVLPALRMEGAFTPDQLLNVVASALEVERRIALVSAEAEERRDALNQERRRQESDFATYLDLDAASTERLRLGLRVMASRAAVAVMELRLQRQETRLAQQRAYLEDLGRQRDYAVANVSVAGLEAAEFEDRLERFEREVEAARQEVATAEARLVRIAEDTPEARAEYRLVQQIVLGAQVREQRARIEVDGSLAILAWLALESDERPPPDLSTRIGVWRANLDGLDSRIETWRASSSGVLLAPTTRDDGSNRQSVAELEQEARTRAQEVLRAVLDLEARIDMLGLVLNLMDERLADRQGGFQRWWIQSRLKAEELYTAAVQLLKTRMFSIGETPVTPGGVLRVLIIMLMAYWISTAIRHALERLSRNRTFMNASSIYTLGRLIHYVIMISALLIALGSLGLDFSSLALIAGALSVGIGFGLQSIVSNFVSGLILLFERSLKVGDYVELDSGLTGHVREINIRSTRINTNDNIDVLVPNSEFVATRLTNWTLRENMARMRIPFGVAYGTDKDLVRRLALEAADKVDFTLRNMPGKDPEVWLVGFGDSSLDFHLLVWVSRSGVRRPGRVQATYLWELHTVFEEHDIEIPFPQRDLHLRSGLEPLRSADDSGSGDPADP